MPEIILAHKNVLKLAHGNPICQLKNFPRDKPLDPILKGVQHRSREEEERKAEMAAREERGEKGENEHGRQSPHNLNHTRSSCHYCTTSRINSWPLRSRQIVKQNSAQVDLTAGDTWWQRLERNSAIHHASTTTEYLNIHYHTRARARRYYTTPQTATTLLQET